ncbi:hypothetical protein C7999DRAFT_42773 [Corynascus novoguineensis]|uniref:Uncharacterized protein n=1 Tax=Corynascus novoguineensis TaxID=1126955 RepID=A0AAN7HDC1_9PEZI|nr:hypothetical protein C7999DRAFT_42773 [Corynascus novoguineensis]
MSRSRTQTVKERSAAHDAPKARKLFLEDLAGDHRRLLIRAIERVLSTEVAEFTYAQIIDGLPTGDVAVNSRDQPYGYDQHLHPIYSAHDELCPGTIEEARQFRHEFQPEILAFDSKLLHEYRACSPGSRGFKIRLIEMVAVAVHQIAAILFDLNTSVHKDDGIIDWAPPKSETLYWRWHPDGPLPTLFKHPWYKDYDQYPRGVADMVGYWAETRILGGVVLFDRRDPNAEPRADPEAVYLHPDRANVTYRICQLLPEQRQALLDFLLADDMPSGNILPLLISNENTTRVDPEEPIQSTGIYRDLWERKNIPPSMSDIRLRDVVNRLEYPTMEDWRNAQRRARDRGERSGRVRIEK